MPRLPGGRRFPLKATVQSGILTVRLIVLDVFLGGTDLTATDEID